MCGQYGLDFKRKYTDKTQDKPRESHTRHINWYKMKENLMNVSQMQETTRTNEEQ